MDKNLFIFCFSHGFDIRRFLLLYFLFLSFLNLSRGLLDFGILLEVFSHCVQHLLTFLYILIIKNVYFHIKFDIGMFLQEFYSFSFLIIKIVKTNLSLEDKALAFFFLLTHLFT